MKQHLIQYLLTLLKATLLAPVVVTSHFFRVVHGLYLLAVQCILGMKEEADNLLDELLSIDL